FDSNDRLMALISDRDGEGLNATDSTGVAIVQIQTFASTAGNVVAHRPGNLSFPWRMLDSAGAVTDGFSAMAFNGSTLFAIQQDGGDSDLVRIDLNTGVVTNLGG